MKSNASNRWFHSTKLKLSMLMIILLIAGSKQINAQCWQWAINTGGSNFENPTSITANTNGVIGIAGEFMGSAVFGNETLTATNGRDVFTALIDSSGTIIKAMSGVGDGISNIATGIGADENGNFYITGTFEKTINFDGTQLVSGGQSDIFIVKYNSSGDLQWAKRAGGSAYMKANDLAVDKEGNVYVVGEYRDSVSFNSKWIYASYATDVFTVKYDTNGNTVWAATSGGNSTDIGNGIAVDYNHNVFITGVFQSDYVFNNTPYNSQGNYDGFIAKYNNDGSPAWAKQVGGASNESFNKIAVDTAGNNIYVTGEFESVSLVADGVTLANNNNIGIRKDIFLLQLNHNGTAQWGISTGDSQHDYSNDVCVDKMGNVYIAGTFNTTSTFGNTTLQNNNGDLFLAKYTQSGTNLWAVKPAANQALGNAKSVTFYKNRPIIAGSLVSGNNHPVVIFGRDTLLSNGSSDVFVAKVGPPCHYPTNAKLISEKTFEFDVYPNPFKNRIEVHNSNSFNESLQIRLSNIRGEILYTNTNQNSESFSIITRDFPAGVYVLQLTGSYNSKMYKLIKN